MTGWLARDELERSGECGCTATLEGKRLVVAADDCAGTGDLAAAPPCRGTVVDELCHAGGDEMDHSDVDEMGSAGIDAVVTRSSGRERAYLDEAAALLVAAGRFVDRCRPLDERLAAHARTDPLSAAREATGRAGRVADLVAETGLALLAERADGYAEVLRPHVGPTVSDAWVLRAPPAAGRLRTVRRLPTGAAVREYEMPGGSLDRYHLVPIELTLDDDTLEALERARSLLARGDITGDDAAHRAARRAVDGAARADRIGDLLQKHTADVGVLVDLFADSTVSDVFANAPIAGQPLGVRVGGDLARTNVRLTERGAGSLASTFRARSERAFSRASPTLDAALTVGERGVRVAAARPPVTDGITFAFRAHDTERWTLQRLVRNDTLPADAAALLSVAVRRAAATLVTGTRGAGKTTLLGALLWELAPSIRTVVIEDTPELPIEALQAAGRNVQALRTSRHEGPGLAPAAALRTALRLGEGALVLGEVRGEEAAVLYEAMRVGASGSAVLGTIHGDSGASVRERVVSDLGVPASSFGVTDLVVTLEPHESGGERRRRVACIEEVFHGANGVSFAELFALEDGQLEPTGRIERANSELLQSLADSTERYESVRAIVDERAGAFRAGTANRSDDGPTAVEDSTWTDGEDSTWTGAERC